MDTDVWFTSHALLMLGITEYAFGLAGDVLSEERLSKLYDMPIRRISFEHDGAQFDTISPVILSGRR